MASAFSSVRVDRFTECLPVRSCCLLLVDENSVSEMQIPADARLTTSGPLKPFGDGLCLLGLSIVTLTIAAIPWFLGGAIPQADLLLQAGAVAAAGCVLTGMLLCGGAVRQVPLTCLPLLGISFIGLIQLLPIYSQPVLQMEHAVQAELVDELPATMRAVVPLRTSARSVMSAETRRWVSRVVSLVLVVLVVFQAARNRNHLLAVTAGITLSGCAMSMMAIPQHLSGAPIVVGNDWKISETTPFGCFVNPNNAAGWLIACLSAALFLTGALFQRSHQPEKQISGLRASRSDRFRRSWITFVNRVADVTPLQILALSAVILLIAAIAATLSRAGIIAAALGLIAFLISRSFSGRFLAAACSLLGLVLVSCSLLVLMDLDTIVLSELRTLKDPVSDTTGRLLHWSDSLKSGLDFPLLGSGLGAYRFATLPYQQRYTGKWFQRADNQYVELFVESGAAGVLCLVGFAFLTLVFVRRASALKTLRAPRQARVADWLGSAVVFLGAALAGAAFFDYGISLPSVAGVGVVLVALLERYSLHPEDPRGARTSFAGLRIELPGVVVVVVWISLMISTSALIPDTLAAARVYSAVAPVERMLNRPDLDVLQVSGDIMLAKLTSALEKRPDDLQGQRARILFLELLFRRELTSGLAAEKTLTADQYENVFRDLTPVRLADRILDEKASLPIKVAVRSEVQAALQKYPWNIEARRLMEQSSCVLTLALPLVACELLLGRDKEALDAVNYARFSEPHGSPALFAMGYFMLQTGRTEDCRSCWAQSIAASDVFYPQIIKHATHSLGADVALDWFMPSTYEACVKCAVELKSVPAIQQSLFSRATQIWDTDSPRATDEIVFARVQHLEATESADEAVQYLDQCLEEHPRSVSLRKSRAKVLERAGRNGEAYDEWLRVQSFESLDPEIQSALDRLIKLPPTT